MDEEVQAQFRKCLRLFRKEMKLKQREASDLLGINYRRWQNWEEKKRFPKIKTIKIMSKKMRDYINVQERDEAV